MSEFYTMKIAGLERNLKLFPVSDSLDIAAFILFGDTEIGIGRGFTVLQAPAYDIAVSIENGALGEGVAHGIRLVTQHISGNIDGHIGSVVNFDEIQELAVGCRIGPVAGQNFTDDNGTAAVHIAAGTRREYQREGHSARK